MKFIFLVLGAVFALCLVVALAVLLLLLQPAPVLNYLSAHWLGLPLSVSDLDYRWDDGRLLCHIQGIEYQHDGPPLKVNIDHLAFDLDLSQVRDRRIVFNEIGMSAAQVSVEQQGAIPWWQQFNSDAAPPAQESEPMAWDIDVQTVQMEKIALHMDLPEQQRAYDLLIDKFSSGRSQQEQRWLQLRGNFDGYPLKIDGEALGIRAIVERREAFDVDLDLSIGEAFLEVHGHLDPFYRLGNTDLLLELDVASLPKVMESFGLQLPPFHSASARARLTDSTGNFDLDDIHLELVTDNASVLVAGSVSEPLQQWQPELEVNARFDSMKTFLAQINVELPVDFYAEAEGRLVRHNGFLELRGTQGGVAFEGFEIAGAHQFGVVGATVRLPKDEIAGWQGPFELPLDVLGGTITAALQLGEEPLFYPLPLQEVAMVIRTDGMELGGKGSYKDVPVKVTFAMDHAWDQLRGKLLAPALELAIGSDLRLPWLPFSFALDADDLMVINQWLRLDFPTATALQAEGEVRVAGDNTLSLYGLSAKVDNGGSVALQLPQYQFEQASELDLEAQFEVPSTAAFAPLADAVIDYVNTDRWYYTLDALSVNAGESPLVDRQYVPFQVAPAIVQSPWLAGGLQGDFILHYDADVLELKSISAAFDGPQLTARVNGHASRRDKLPDVDLDIESTVPADGLLDLPHTARLSGRILSVENTVYTQALELHGGESRIRLDARLENPFADKPRLVASINSDYLRLAEFYQAEESGAVEQAVEDEMQVQPPGEDDEVSPEQFFFSTEPWDLDFLDAFDAMVSVRMEQLAFSQFKLERLHADISLKNGELTILPLKLIALDGTVVSAFSRRVEGEQSVWQMNLAMDGVDAAGFDSLTERANQGIFSARVNLDSRGDSPHEFMSHLSGRLTEQTQDMILYGVDLDALAPDFLRRTISLLNPFSGDEEEAVKTDLECQVGHVLLGDGLLNMDRSMLIRTPSSTFVVSWFVDFSTEQQRAQLIPRLRRGLGLSTTDIARTVQVTGTLLDPSLVVDPEGLFLVGAGSAALYVTGGWLVYFTWRQIERSMKRPDACEKAATKYMALDRSELKLPEREGKLHEDSAQPTSSRSERGRRTR